MIALQLVAYQIEHILWHYARVLANVQYFMIVGLKAADELAVFKSLIFTFIFFVMHVVAKFKMLIFIADSYRYLKFFHGCKIVLTTKP